MDEATHESDADWWLSGDGRWHEGTPPPGWTLAADRRWYLDEPPPSARGYAAKWESTAGAPAIVVVPAALGVLDVPDVPDLPDDHDGAGRRRRALATVALVALLVVAGVITAQLWPEAGGDEAGPVVAAHVQHLGDQHVDHRLPRGRDAAGAGPDRLDDAFDHPGVGELGPADRVHDRGAGATAVRSAGHPRSRWRAAGPGVRPPGVPVLGGRCHRRHRQRHAGHLYDHRLRRRHRRPGPLVANDLLSRATAWGAPGGGALHAP